MTLAKRLKGEIQHLEKDRAIAGSSPGFIRKKNGSGLLYRHLGLVRCFHHPSNSDRLRSVFWRRPYPAISARGLGGSPLRSTAPWLAF